MFDMKLIRVCFSVIFVVYASAELSKAIHFDGNDPVVDSKFFNNYNDAVESIVNNDKTDHQARNYDEIDPVMDMLLNNEYENPVEPPTNKDEEGVESEMILYPDGVWKCGNCTNMKEMKLLYSDAYNHYINYGRYVEKLNIDIQMGLSFKNMRCITMDSEKEIDVRLVSGACAGEEVTLGVMRASHFVISVYG